MAGIFVSYRRSGASSSTYRLVNELQREFGEAKIFLDVESIDPGVPFAEAISNAISKCNVVLVVIGPSWLEMKNEQGQRRLDEPKDWIRREIEIALESRAKVIPVLVEGAKVPEAEDLPESIASLAGLNGYELAANKVHWDFDVSRLVKKLRGKVGHKKRNVMIGVAVMALLVFVVQFEQQSESVPREQRDPVALTNDGPLVEIPAARGFDDQKQPAGSNADLSGEWYSNEGIRYSVRQQGSQFSATVYDGSGDVIEESRGTISGRAVTFNYQDSDDYTGTGKGTLQADNTHLHVTFTDAATGHLESTQLHRGHYPH